MNLFDRFDKIALSRKGMGMHGSEKGKRRLSTALREQQRTRQQNC